MENTIRVQIRDVYGRLTTYPACPNAVCFAAIAGTRTLTDETLRQIERLGFRIVVESPRVTRASR
jgi:hypothetical protein